MDKGRYFESIQYDIEYNVYWDLGISRYSFVGNVFFHHFMAKCLDESYGGCVMMIGEIQNMVEIIGEKA